MLDRVTGTVTGGTKVDRIENSYRTFEYAHDNLSFVNNNSSTVCHYLDARKLSEKKNRKMFIVSFAISIGMCSASENELCMETVSFVGSPTYSPERKRYACMCMGIIK